MEEETRKRNTDCLYFLASPLTCKKGSECEYRHSDSARLNPRDCWYWLNGNCRNPNCAFRHPPLEVFNGFKADAYYPPSFSTVSVSKPNIPCYFYFNAICSKGDQCPFLHEEFHSQKLVSKPTPESAANHPLENKISSGDTGPASVELPVYPPTESLMETIKTNNHHPKEVSCSPSVESLVPEFEEPPADNPLPSIEFLDHRGQLSPYSSSEEIVKESIEQDLEERWESSPGFDVLVDDGSDHMAYEDDAEYRLVQNRESELRHSHLLEYDFEGSTCYEQHTGYPDTGYLYDGLYENYDPSDDIYGTRNYYQLKLREEEMKFDPRHDNHMKQNLLRRVHEDHDRDDFMALHERLGKHRRVDAHWIPLSSRKRRRSNPHGSSKERPTRRGTNNGSIHCRLTSQVGRCMITASSHVEDEFTHNYHDRQGWRGQSGASRLARHRNKERERRRRRFPHFSSEVQLSSPLDEEESVRIKSNGSFDGPKTLAQIKEEKSRAKADDGNNSVEYLPQVQRQRQAAADFEGPKPLEELLKHKRSEKPQASKCAELEHFDNTDCLVNGDGNEDYDDDDDADDAFRKRLVHILSQ